MTDSSTASLVLQQFIPYRMVNLAKRISDAYSHIYSGEFGLTIPEWRILVHLGEKSPLNAKDLGEIGSMDKSKVSRAVKFMEDKGYLVKERDQEDNRASYLSLTDEGYQLYHALAPKALEWEASLLEALGTTEYRDLMRILGKLEARVTVLEKGPNPDDQ